MPSLKSKLIEKAKEVYPNYLTFAEAEQIAKESGRKVSNMEKRFREASAGDYPLIGKIKSDKGAIIGYRYIPANEIKFIPKPIIQTQEQLFNPNRVIK